MAEITLVAEPRSERGSAPSRRIRVEGHVPGVVYGHSIEPTPVAVDARELRAALMTEAGANALFNLDIAGKRHLAIARALQRHPVRHSISHVDFQVVSRDEVVPADVPVVIVGEALAVHRGDGSVEHLLQVVHVRAKPADIPPHFEIDITELEIGDMVRVGDLSVGAGVSIETDAETAVVIAHPPRAVVESETTTTAEEAAAGAQGAAGEATESAEEPAENS